MIATKYTRLTAVGNIKDTPGMLHWLIVSNPDSDDRYVILNDATSGTGDEVAKFLVKSHKTEVFTFNPPIPMVTGIRIGTFNDADMVVTGGYS